MKRRGYYGRKRNWKPITEVDKRTATTRGMLTKAVKNLIGWKKKYIRDGYDCQMDHIEPLCQDGSFVLENLWLITGEMNRQFIWRSPDTIRAIKQAASADRTKLYTQWPSEVWRVVIAETSRGLTQRSLRRFYELMKRANQVGGSDLTADEQTELQELILKVYPI